MGRLFVVGFFLLVSLLVCLAYEPDSGTAAYVGPPDLYGDIVGANHAKPLPRAVNMTEVVLVTALVFLYYLGSTRPSPVGVVRLRRDDERRPRRVPVWVRAHARRGPPAPVAG